MSRKIEKYEQKNLDAKMSLNIIAIVTVAVALIVAGFMDLNHVLLCLPAKMPLRLRALLSYPRSRLLISLKMRSMSICTRVLADLSYDVSVFDMYSDMLVIIEAMLLY
jgi:hypothetical protein